MRRLSWLILAGWLATQVGPAAAQGCDCSADVYNCPEFANQASAQACFEQCRNQAGEDIHDLDRDSNGIACEDSVFTGSLDFSAPAATPPAAPIPAPQIIPPSGEVRARPSSGWLWPAVVIGLLATVGIMQVKKAQ